MRADLAGRRRDAVAVEAARHLAGRRTGEQVVSDPAGERVGGGVAAQLASLAAVRAGAAESCRDLLGDAGWAGLARSTQPPYSQLVSLLTDR